MEYYNSDAFIQMIYPYGLFLIWIVGFIAVYFTVEQKDYVESMTWIFFLGIFWQYAFVLVLVVAFGLAIIGTCKGALWIFTATMNKLFGGTRGIR